MNIKLKKLFLLLSLTFFSLPASAFEIESIDVKGNNRLSKESIIASTPFKENKTYSEEQVHRAYKMLYKTNLFKKVDIVSSGKNLIIDVEENPLIRTFSLEGNKDIDDDKIQKNIKSASYEVFSRSQIKKDTQTILDMYKAMGFLSATVEPKIIPLNNNMFDVVMEINESDKSYIDTIIFSGNVYLTDSDLSSSILSTEYAWWKFLANFDTYDEARTKHDISLIKKAYYNKGFLDAKVDAQATSSLDKSGYIVKFDIVEGARYKVNNISYTANNLTNLKESEFFKNISDIASIEENSYYSLENDEKTTRSLNSKIEQEGFSFVNIDSEVEKNKSNKTVNINYNLTQAPKIYINNINISGNTVTKDSVVKNFLTFSEKDTFSKTKAKSSKQILQSTGFFENIVLQPTPVGNSKLDMNISLEEMNTGEISFSAGWSTLNGLLLEIGLQERNFLGKGHIFSASVSTSELKDSINVSYTDPHFFKRNVSGGLDVYFNNLKYQEYYGYDVLSAGIFGSSSWRYNDRLSQLVRVGYRVDDRTNFNNNAPQFILDEKGKTQLTTVYQKLTYKDRDIEYLTGNLSGYSLSLSNEYTIPGSDENYFKTGLEFKAYKSFFGNELTTRILVNGDYAFALEDDYLQRSYRYFLGGFSLRGFEIAGIGARSLDGQYSYGGDWRLNGTAEVEFPIGLPKSYKIKGVAFFDWGVLGKPSGYIEGSMLYTGSVRSSFGLGINWNSPMGPLSLTWGWPISKEEFDQEERFRLSVQKQF